MKSPTVLGHGVFRGQLSRKIDPRTVAGHELCVLAIRPVRLVTFTFQNVDPFCEKFVPGCLPGWVVGAVPVDDGNHVGGCGVCGEVGKQPLVIHPVDAGARPQSG